MSTKQKFCEHCRDFVYTITYRQHLVHNCAVLLPPPAKKCKHCQDFIYTRTCRQHLVHNCAVLFPPPAKKCKLDGVKNQVPFSVPLCFRSCSCPLQGGVSYLRLDCIFLCCHGPLSTTCTYNSITPTAINFEVLIPYEKMCAE